jgi:hypothetical protein
VTAIDASSTNFINAPQKDDLHSHLSVTRIQRYTLKMQKKKPRIAEL